MAGFIYGWAPPQPRPESGAFVCPRIDHSVYRFGCSWRPLDGMEPHHLVDLIDSSTESDGVRIDPAVGLPVLRYRLCSRGWIFAGNRMSVHT